MINALELYKRFVEPTQQPLQERASVLPLGQYQDDYAYGGVKKRQPYESENAFFRSNPHVAGMATEDNRVTLNPFTGLTPDQQDAVAMNESARVWMRKPEWNPYFDLTDDQATRFASYGSPTDQKSTVTARILSRDQSAGSPTQDQLEFAQRLASQMARTDYDLEDAGAKNAKIGLAWPGMIADPAKRVGNALDAAFKGDQSYYFGDDGHLTNNAIMAGIDMSGLAMTGGLSAAAMGGMADDAAKASAQRSASSQQPLPRIDPNALSGEIIDSPQEMIRRAQQSPLWPKSWFEAAGGHAGRPQTFDNLLDAARFVYRFEAEDKWNAAVAQAAGGSRPVGNALQQAEAKAFADNPQTWWDSRRMLQEQVEGREGHMGDFDRVWDRVDAPPTTDVVSELLGTGIINDAYLGPKRGRPKLLSANAPTGAAVPAGMEASDTDPALLEYLKAIGLY